MTTRKVYNDKKCVLKVFNFVKKFKFLKSANIFENPQLFFFFVSKCKQKEPVNTI